MPKIRLMMIVFFFVLTLTTFSGGDESRQNKGFIVDQSRDQDILKPHPLSDEYRDSYLRLIRVYERYAALEESVFSKLSFTLSNQESQINIGHSLKFVLHDQFNRQWMFKVIKKYKDGADAGPISLDDAVKSVGNSFVFLERLSDAEKQLFVKMDFLEGRASFKDLSGPARQRYLSWEEKTFDYSNFTAVPSSRFYALFGINSPEMHYKLLNINGRFILGTLQKIVPYDYTFNERTPDEYTDESLDSLIKIYVLNWLFGVANPNPNDYLIDEENGKMSAVTRVDLSIYFPSLSEKTTELFTFSDENSIYGHLWGKYLRHELSLPFMENYTFIAFVSLFPPKEFREFLQPITSKSTIKILQKRKERLAKELVDFFNQLSGKRGESFALLDQPTFSEITDAICEKFENKIAALEKEWMLVKTEPEREEPDFNLPMSEEGYRLISRLQELNNFIDIDRNFVDDETSNILNALSGLWQRADNNENEKNTIMRYIDRVKQYKEYLHSGIGYTDSVFLK